jgi:hypothetical protein
VIKLIVTKQRTPFFWILPKARDLISDRTINVLFLDFSLSLICIGFHGRPFSSERNDAFEQALTDIIELLEKEKFKDNLER